jgi:hypothetical protein
MQKLPMKTFLLAFAVLVLALGATTQAKAQISNRPFAFQSGGGPGFGSFMNLGISPAYQQLILQRKLLGRSAANGTFFVGSGGALVDITRSGSQAFPTAVAAPFVTSAAGGPSGFSVGAFGYAGDENSAAYGLGPRGAPAATVPIDSWINQLNSMSPPSS